MENTVLPSSSSLPGQSGFDKSAKWVLAKLVMVFHFVFVSGIFGLPFFASGHIWLLVSILLNVVLLTLWYMVGTCPLNFVENYLLEKTHTDQNGQPKNNFIYALSSMLGEHGDKILYHGFSVFPLVCVSVACYKLL